MTGLDSIKDLYSNFIRPLLDITLLSFILYKLYTIIIRSYGMQLIKGGIVLALSYAVILILNLSTLQWLMETIAPGIVIGVAIIFQPEIRKIFIKLGQGDWFKIGSKIKHSNIDSVLLVAETLSKKRRGMLIVFVRRVSLKNIADTGTKIQADISSSLLLSFFEFDSALHDGAALIQGQKVVAAGCFLPLSEQNDIKKTFGTRHRAALGLSEESDAVVLIVSEETGAISLAFDSKLYYDLTMEQLNTMLAEQLAIVSAQNLEKEELLDDKTDS
ncbi:MAG: diadenylate cyclase CdaA [Treponemataceae bacterium]